jgi:hypothetical protein
VTGKELELAGKKSYILRAISPREIRVALYVLKCLCCWLLLLAAAVAAGCGDRN